MALRLSRQATTDVDDIWKYLAKESGSPAIADRLIDAITDRFLLLTRQSARRTRS